jgi:hypothetical protein
MTKHSVSVRPLLTRTGRISGMAAIKGRKHRVGVRDHRPMTGHVPPEIKAKAESMAAALGISLGAYLEELLRREQVDEHGRPVWWTDPAPRDQEELPLKTA